MLYYCVFYSYSYYSYILTIMYYVIISMALLRCLEERLVPKDTFYASLCILFTALFSLSAFSPHIRNRPCNKNCVESLLNTTVCLSYIGPYYTEYTINRNKICEAPNPTTDTYSAYLFCSGLCKWEVS